MNTLTRAARARHLGGDVSMLALALFTLHCGAVSSPSPLSDGGGVDTGDASTSDGGLACGSARCQRGELCEDRSNGSNYKCVAIPPACRNDLTCTCIVRESGCMYPPSCRESTAGFNYTCPPD
jgi:hypothetical protein